MAKNKPIYIFSVILIAIVTIAISVVVYSYNKNKVIVPDVGYTEELSLENLTKIKEQYDTANKKTEFIELCSEIELAVANKLLDGSVTNDEELASAVNAMFNTNDWTYIGVEYPTYWMGSWGLDKEARLKFSFLDDNIKPSWTQDEDVVKYMK